MARSTVLIEAGDLLEVLQDAQHLVLSGATPMTRQLRRRIDAVLGDVAGCFTLEREGGRLVAVPSPELLALVGTIRAQARR